MSPLIEIFKKVFNKESLELKEIEAARILLSGSMTAAFAFYFMTLGGGIYLATTIAYVILLFLSKSLLSYIAKENIKRTAKKLGVPIKYDPANPFTLGQFKYDRLLQVRKILKDKKLVEVHSSPEENSDILES